MFSINNVLLIFKRKLSYIKKYKKNINLQNLKNLIRSYKICYVNLEFVMDLRLKSLR